MGKKDEVTGAPAESTEEEPKAKKGKAAKDALEASGCPHGAPTRGHCNTCTAEDEAAAAA